jgi:hypothetical protein
MTNQSIGEQGGLTSETPASNGTTTKDDRCAADLTDFGNAVPTGYGYFEKRISPREDFSHPSCHLKWYDIYPADLPVTPRQREEARSFLKEEIESHRLQLESELGFVCLHHCRRVLLLLVMTWRNTNEIWESAFMKELKENDTYKPIEYPTRHRGTYCVWELGAVWHERNAWVRFLNSPRDNEAKLVYVNDRFSGSV